VRITHCRIDYSEKPDRHTCLLFTGNAFVKKNGALVMGRGAAQQVRDAYPGADRWFGQRISQQGDVYGVIINPINGFGIFQVKDHFSEDANLTLIATSARDLRVVAWTFPDILFRCNYPGIGNGKLSRDDVEPVLDAANLPDNVEFAI